MAACPILLTDIVVYYHGAFAYVDIIDISDFIEIIRAVDAEYLSTQAKKQKSQLDKAKNAGKQ